MKKRKPQSIQHPTITKSLDCPVCNRRVIYQSSDGSSYFDRSDFPTPCPRCNDKEFFTCPICSLSCKTRDGVIALFYGFICYNCEKKFERPKYKSRLKKSEYKFVRVPMTDDELLKHKIDHPKSKKTTKQVIIGLRDSFLSF